MSDIHQGFQNVDQAAETASFFQFLDAAAALPSLQGYRQQMAELCPPTAGQRILDVGCGIGHRTLHLAQRVPAPELVVGIDSSGQMIAEAQCRAAGCDLPLTDQVGTAEEIDFSDGSFDLCQTERVLMYLADPQAALAEMVRMVRPGGMVLGYEFDYDGIVVDAPDQPLTRQLTHYLADSVPSPWIGRQLPRLFRERALQEITVIPHMILTPYEMFQRVVGGTLDHAVQTGAFAADAVAEWWCSLAAAEEAGHFLSGFPGFLVAGRCPRLHSF